MEYMVLVSSGIGRIEDDVLKGLLNITEEVHATALPAPQREEPSTQWPTPSSSPSRPQARSRTSPSSDSNSSLARATQQEPSPIPSAALSRFAITQEPSYTRVGHVLSASTTSTVGAP